MRSCRTSSRSRSQKRQGPGASLVALVMPPCPLLPGATPLWICRRRGTSVADLILHGEVPGDLLRRTHPATHMEAAPAIPDRPVHQRWLLFLLVEAKVETIPAVAEARSRRAPGAPGLGVVQSWTTPQPFLPRESPPPSPHTELGHGRGVNRPVRP